MQTILLAVVMHVSARSGDGGEPLQLRQPAAAFRSATQPTHVSQRISSSTNSAQPLTWRRKQRPQPSPLHSHQPRRTTILPTSGVAEVRGGASARNLSYDSPFGVARATTATAPRVAQLGEKNFDPFREETVPPGETELPEATTPQTPGPPPTVAPSSALPNALRDSTLQPLPPNSSPAADTTPGAPVPSEAPAGQSPPPPPFEVPAPNAATPQTLPNPQPSGAPQTLPDPQDNLLRDPAANACQQVYNGRDCCRTANTCRRAHERLESTSIRQVQLDITPKFKPNVGVLRPEEDEQYAASIVARERAFEELDSRDWKNKAGAVLTTGRFVDFVNGRVLIETTAGEVVRIPYTELSADDNCFVAAWWQIPGECSLKTDDPLGRDWLASTLTWKASALCHKPLYFEQVQLERYGHSAGPIKQPILSGAHFFVNIATLPYKMGIHPPRECQYALGYYRPGSCAPWLIPPVPLSVRGALAQTAAVAAGIYILP